MDFSSANSRNAGAATFRLISANTTNATVVNVGPGKLFSVQIGNSNATFRVVKLYDSAVAPVVGTTVPWKTIIVGPSGGTVNLNFGPDGDLYLNGLAIATTTGVADSDTNAVGTNDLAINLSYR